MAWSGTKNWTNEPLIAADMNTYLSDALDALKEPPSDDVTLTGVGTNATTSNTNWEPIGGVGTEVYSITVTLAAGESGLCNGLIGFYGNFLGASAITSLDVAIDGTRAGIGDNGLIGLMAAASAPGLLGSFVHRFMGLSAGSHTFVMYWKVNSGSVTHYRNAGTANADLSPQFWVRAD
jgi:hypothetical protein